MAGLTQQSSDVRFREIDLSQSLKNRSTANAAIVLVSSRGRLGRYNVTNWTDFVAEYGERNASVSFGHYCAKDFFDEGNYLDVVRVAGSGYKYAACVLKDAAGVTGLTPVTGGISDPDNIDWSTVGIGSDTGLLLFYPKSGPGSYANTLAVKISSQNLSTPTAPSTATAATGGTIVAGTYNYRIAAISSIGQTLASAQANVTVSGTSTAVITLTWTAVEGARGYYIYGRTTAGEGLLATVGATVLTYDDNGSVVVDTTKLPITNPVNLPTPTTQFTVEVYDNAVNTSTPQETWTCTLTDETDGNGVQLEATQQINAFSTLINVESRVAAIVGTIPAVKNVAKTSLTGGASGSAPTNGQIATAWTENFSDTEKISVNILINAGYTDTGVQKSMIALAEARGDAFAILDTPSSMQKYSDAITYRQLVLNANTSYAGLYSSDSFTSDNYNGKNLYVPSSGRVAAVFARTDRVAGPQYAPAGLNRGLVDVLKLRYDYTEPQRTQLFNAQVNYLRTFIGAGTAVFEQVTLQNKQSALSWVNVRRMVNTIKGGVKDYLMYSLHEPNDDFLRRQIVTSLTEYLQYWKDARGILDFKVVADETNNPPSKYNLGILTVSIIITPVIAVHEIGVDIIITKSGVSFSEINLAALG